MNLLFLRDWVREKAINANIGYADIETLYDVNELLNKRMPCLMFNYEQESNQYRESPFTEVNLKIYLIKNFFEAEKIETELYERDYITPAKNELNELYKDFLRYLQREEAPIIEVLRDTKLQLAERVSIEGFLIMEATITINVERQFCLDESQGDFCAPVTYLVEYENGTLIEQGSEQSGGNIFVQVPNPSQCDNATYNLDNTEGATLFSGSIPSGDNETIIAPDGTATVKNTAGTTVATGLVPSGSGADITAPDATFSINSTQVATIPSGTSDSIEVRKQSGSNQIGALQGQHWRIDNSAITLKDTANNTLSTTSVPATESADIIAPNGNIENTNETFIESVLSGGTLILNDQNVEVNGQLEGAFVSMQTLEIETLDEDMNITSPIVSFASEILTIKVETLDTFTWAFLVVNWDNPPTFVATIAGYDIYLYTLNSVDRYRSVPEPYVNSLDAFWEDFDGTNLINLITNRL